MVRDRSDQPDESGIMSEHGGWLQKFSAGCKKSLPGAVLLLALNACGRQQNLPAPPKAPPRPVTSAGMIVPAQFVLPARPVPPSPGEM
jgi:hypothetical protein